MELTFVQLSNLNETLNALSNQALPFKLSLLIAKNTGLIQKEIEFYIEQERVFANKYLQKDETGNFVQETEGVFKINEGMEEECRKAREELDAFTSNVDLRKIPVALIENLELTPKQVMSLEPIIEEASEE